MLREAGIVLLASATSVAEGRAAANAGVQAVVAQGYEAGGHRGLFDADAEDGCLGTMALTRLLCRIFRSGIVSVHPASICDSVAVKIAPAMLLGGRRSMGFRVLVVGGTGQVGSGLVRALRAASSRI
jgi:nitronate monooxygenase